MSVPSTALLAVSALFVQTDGAYFGLPHVDPWDEKRDARKYAGPNPVVAHPPCQRWGRFWFGCPLTVKRTGVRKVKGDDGGWYFLDSPPRSDYASGSRHQGASPYVLPEF